ADAKAKADAEAKAAAQAETNYKTAIVRGDADMKFKKYKEAVGAYSEALTYKPGDAYATTKLAEAQKKISSDDNTEVKKGPHPLSLKYPQGVTEEVVVEKGVVIIKRIVVKGDDAWVFTMKKFNWGGIVYKKDEEIITQSVWDMETKK
ncbi:MAG: hypothetical protein ACXVNR_12685, partial [Bacteroidia bacterium]